MFSDVRINGAEWIIKQVDVTVLVDGTGQRDPLFLAATQLYALTHNTTFCNVNTVDRRLKDNIILSTFTTFALPDINFYQHITTISVKNFTVS